MVSPNNHLPSQIVAHLPTKNPNAATMLDRILRMLACHSVLGCSVVADDFGSFQRLYSLSPVSKHFVRNEDGVVGSLIGPVSRRGLHKKLVCFLIFFLPLRIWKVFLLHDTSAFFLNSHVSHHFSIYKNIKFVLKEFFLFIFYLVNGDLRNLLIHNFRKILILLS